MSATVKLKELLNFRDGMNIRKFISVRMLFRFVVQVVKEKAFSKRWEEIRRDQRKKSRYLAFTSTQISLNLRQDEGFIVLMV